MKTTVLCVLDGLGLNPNNDGNAFALANTPIIDSLLASKPNSTLQTHGEKVGLPAGQMGNSEVGHLNIGAGRVVFQWLARINKALEKKALQSLPGLEKFLECNKTTDTIHLCGLYSDGGVHSHLQHLQLLVEIIQSNYNGQISLHLFTDGRDTAPNSAIDYVKDLESFLETIDNCEIASIQGRFYAMDRDQRWERTQKAYDCLTKETNSKAVSASDWIKTAYEQGTTDEFIEPVNISQSFISENDAVLFWNFRADRMRQLVKAICLETTDIQKNLALNSKQQVLCCTEYDATFNLPILFENVAITNHLGACVARASLSQLRVAETEKYPHVTYFLNGGQEQELPGEVRELVPSPREVKTYDQKPEMSAYQVKDVVCNAIQNNGYDLIVVNFANCDMVGHTGSLDAAIKAVETVDQCLGEILEVLKQHTGQALIIADHGNCEQMINYETRQPHTAHTTYPVPIILVSEQEFKLRNEGTLSDVAPTVLALMNLEQPQEMTGQSLLA